MKRGEIWTAASSGPYSSKPRPVVILQDDRFDATESVTICPLTSAEAELPLFRILIEASVTNGLRSSSRLMVDKIATVPRSNVDAYVGRLTAAETIRLNRALIVFLGIAARA